MDPPPMAHLMDELIEEVLVCIPPDNPTSLLRVGPHHGQHVEDPRVASLLLP
jgi:hypothetical protein